MGSRKDTAFQFVQIFALLFVCLVGSFGLLLLFLIYKNIRGSSKLFIYWIWKNSFFFAAEYYSIVSVYQFVYSASSSSFLGLFWIFVHYEQSYNEHSELAFDGHSNH